MTDLPLDGVRVLEMASGVAPAYCGHLLAGFGADVVRAEAIDGSPSDELTSEETTYLVAGKRRVSVDDRQLLDLALQADLVIEGLLPATRIARGIEPRELIAARPELVVTSITPHGQSGRYRDHLADNITVFASGGIMALTGDPDRPPLQTGGTQALYLGGLHGFAATTTAYLGVLVHGEGDWLDISMQECAASMLELYGAMWEYDGELAGRLGNSVRALWGVYPVRDGYAGVCALERQVPALFALIGDPALEEDRFVDPVLRAEHNDELLAHVLAWMSDRTKDELVELSPVHRVPLGAVRTPEELLDDDGLAERGFFDRVDTPAGVVTVPGRPFPGLGWRSGDLRPAGADTDAVLADWSDTR
jgi:crotonobetainyl-CoA:carnitine CoA-transferase CaiB-like acyl-CoA transferase